MLREFCDRNDLTIQNTLFHQPKRRLYTWTSPNEKTRSQIDYIISQNRWKTDFKNCKTYPSADCGSDHQLLVGTIRLKLRNKPRTTAIRRPNMKVLDFTEIHDSCKSKIQNRFNALLELSDELEPDDLWKAPKEILLNVAEEKLTSDTREPKSKWITTNTIELCDERRKQKQKKTSALKTCSTTKI